MFCNEMSREKKLPRDLGRQVKGNGEASWTRETPDGLLISVPRMQDEE